MTFSQNRWFWLLQMIGWSLLVGTSIWAKLSFAKELKTSYILAEGFIIFLSGFIVSTLLRYFLKKNIQIDQFQKINYFKLFILYFISSVIFASLLLTSIPVYKYFQGKEMELNRLFFITQYLNSFIFFFLWILLYFGIKLIQKFRKEKLERLELEASLKESQLNTLKGQINPHFMFNSLNNIRGLMLEDVDKSREMITRLSEMLRYSLTKSNVDKITLEEELEMVNNYIALSKIQFEERLTYQQNVSDKLVSLKIPPMLIQMLIENAIKHGISNQPNGGIVNLTINESNKMLQINVSNTGSLISENNTTKVGIQNIKKRLHLLYQNKASFNLSEYNNIVTASLQVPL